MPNTKQDSTNAHIHTNTKELVKRKRIEEEIETKKVVGSKGEVGKRDTKFIPTKTFYI
jgi:hypothetical protein